MSDSAQVEALVDGCVERFGRLDCAFNNAGVGGESARLADYDEETWDRVLAVNLTGVFLCMKSELRQMMAQDGGAIVNAASLVGVTGYPEPRGVQRGETRRRGSYTDGGPRVCEPWDPA